MNAASGRGDSPLVSVVIPAYNGASYLEQAVASVLAQTYADIECIVVDDGSTDATAEVARGFGPAVTLLQQENTGVASARNRGAAAARGDLLAFLDADDAWLPEKLQRQVEVLRNSPGAGIVLCAMWFTDAELTPTTVVRFDPEQDLLERLVLLDGLGMVGVSQAALMRRSCFESVGGFDTRFSTSADWDLLVRILRSHSWTFVDEPLVLYRVHAGSMSGSAAATEHDMLLGLGQLFADPDLDPRLKGLRHRAYGNLHRLLAGAYYQAGDHRRFLKHTCRALRHDPAELGYYLRWPSRRLSRRKSLVRSVA